MYIHTPYKVAKFWSRVAALVRSPMNRLQVTLWEDNRANNRNNPKTIWAANNEKNYKLTRAATLLKFWTSSVYHFQRDASSMCVLDRQVLTCNFSSSNANQSPILPQLRKNLFWVQWKCINHNNYNIMLYAIPHCLSSLI